MLRNILSRLFQEIVRRIIEKRKSSKMSSLEINVQKYGLKFYGQNFSVSCGTIKRVIQGSK